MSAQHGKRSSLKLKHELCFQYIIIVVNKQPRYFLCNTLYNFLLECIQVGCVPSAAGAICPGMGGGCLLCGGVNSGGVCSRKCLLPSGVSAPEGVSAPGGGIPACTEADTPSMCTVMKCTITTMTPNITTHKFC